MQLTKLQNRATEGFSKYKFDLLKSFIFTFIWGLAAHGYMFLNNSFSLDSLMEFITNDYTISTKLRVGRMFVPIYEYFTRGFITVPWLIGLLGLAYVSLTLFVITRIFNNRSTSFMVITSGILTANITVAVLNATFIHDFDCDMLALLLATVAVYLWNKYKYGFLCGIPFVLFALGLYQSYLSVAITLMVIVSVINLLRGDKSSEVFIKGIKGIAMALVAGILYFISIKLAILISGIELSSGMGNSLDTILHSGVKEIFASTINTYIYTVKRVLVPVPNEIFRYRFVVLTHIVLYGIAFSIMCVVAYKRKIKIGSLILIAALIALMPFGMNVAQIISVGFGHDVMYYAFWLGYVFVALIVWEFVSVVEFKKLNCGLLVKAAVFVVTLAIVLGNIRISNTLYTMKDFEQDAHLAAMSNVVAKMEEFEEYIPGETPVVFVRTMAALTEDVPEFASYRGFIGMMTRTPLGGNDMRAWQSYFDYVLMKPCKMANTEKRNELCVLKEVEDMPHYPNDGFIKVIDGILVVKLGELN